MTHQRPVVLIVDDDVEVGQLLAEVLAPSYDTHSVSSAAAALAVLAETDVAIVVADQRMPDMSGLDLLAEVRRLRPTAVGVLITAHANVHDAIRAINSERILGFLSKPWEEQELLGVMHRALDAHLALRQLVGPSRAAERELDLFQSLAGSAPTPITAQRFGILPLRDSLPREFEQLSAEYAHILGLALQQRAFKIDGHTSRSLHDLADRLGALSAGPRDVIDMHVLALKERLTNASRDEAMALIEEGRLLVLELMGDVVTYYRSYTLGVRA